ncbi:MAG: tetratricopeptide repeat protein [Gemmatimonadales bacterium]|nr:tetratricopeptide repeat protein [Gemmatimonadales bacterium]NIN10861.1 tetratricopeptide repeat protein [Gemmatimonadales bacterium]NIR02869.1 tetratricopeptide repeat protein [Gemmatimonadales bacterium]NIS66503.1 tetratricopeptide repeat protein [Gemmatimonadales bacterium]
MFPPDIIAPTMWWEDQNSAANRWHVTIGFPDGGDPVAAEVDTTAWSPDSAMWEMIKRRSVGKEATITVTSLRRVLVIRQTLARQNITISTSGDSVAAPIFYRDVPLPFRFALRNVPMIRWRLGDISSYSPPPVVLTNLPVCGNCHSFSGDGRTLGMDVDIGNDKGAYAITAFEEKTVLSPDKLISWSAYVRDRRVPTFGMLPRVSPDGRYVLAGVKDRAVFLPREDILFSQIFFPVMGILAYYDAATGRIAALTGADDEEYVQTNGVWTPDGREVIFARSRAAQLKTENPDKGILLNTEECAEVLGGREFLAKAQEGGKAFKFDLYRLPFNGGRGGRPEPIEGASRNGMSNFFPKVSPDGRWLVFTQAHSFMLLQPDSKLYIMPASGGTPRLLNANTPRMNSWHSWSPNSRWLVFSSKMFGPHTQLFLTHIDEGGNDTPPVILQHFTSSYRAANIPEFVNIPAHAARTIDERFINDYNYFRSGRIYEQFREYDRAEEEFLKSLRMNPENTSSLYSLATLYAKRKDYDEAIRAFQRILEIEPDAVVHKDLGSLYFTIGEYDKAEAEFRAAVRLDPHNVAAHFNLGTLYLMQHDLARAEREFALLLDLDIESAAAVRVHSNLGHIFVARGDYRRAIREYRAVLVLDSLNLDARHNLALSYRVLKDLTNARREFEVVVRLDPGNVEAHNALGEILLQAGDYPSALEVLTEAVTRAPDNIVAQTYLGHTYYQMGDFENAEQVFLRIITRDPGNVFAHVNLGRVYHETARYDEAVAAFKRVGELNPNHAAAYFMLGEALVREGRSMDEAIRAFKQGLSLDPSYVEGHVSLGDLYVVIDDPVNALEEFELALGLDPADSNLRGYLEAKIDDLRQRLRD